MKSRSIPGFLALDTKQKSFFPSCLGLCLQRLLKAAAWVRPNEWTHRWSALSACICHHVDGGGLLSKVFAASVRTGLAPLPPLQSQSSRDKLWSGPRGLALASLKVTWPQAPCFIRGSRWSALLIPEQTRTKTAILSERSFRSERERERS